MHTVATGAVVVEVDGSADGLRVVDFASADALRTGADLLLAAPYRSFAGAPPQRPPWSRDEAERRLREAVAHVHRQIGHQIPVRTVARDGHRLDVLAQLGWTARLLVVPRQRARGPQRLVAAAHDVALAARSRCPVIVVPREWKPSRADRIVAVGVDGTALSWEAVEYAFSAAEQRAGKLVVVHADTPPCRPVSQDAEQAWIAANDLTVAETLAGWQERHPDVPVVRLVTSEPVLEALPRRSALAGLLVLGVHVDRNRTIGDPVARRAVAAATCPVAMVRHHVTVSDRQRLPREVSHR
jgi:nucleotide-binding universal stress UspA family protein